jgi:hypothetical protein
MASRSGAADHLIIATKDQQLSVSRTVSRKEDRPGAVSRAGVGAMIARNLEHRIYYEINSNLRIFYAGYGLV